MDYLSRNNNKARSSNPFKLWKIKKKQSKGASQPLFSYSKILGVEAIPWHRCLASSFWVLCHHRLIAQSIGDALYTFSTFFHNRKFVLKPIQKVKRGCGDEELPLATLKYLFNNGNLI
ncbi:hypothetical protein GPALN_014387 [Globodera pallida]|nr:hypothetical protein GPALN_014387 [Globodera pallida]